ncbi:DUF3500 domain-containing protein [Jiangella rhizosphaerae]|uniref:DUF3500 domain-containing protein n=1 Tax=Jiangella rhizosphaerae TaxID=2293569 RepID=A0A418KXK2_9ACTN|nr:DUF3500 domain-containing protein [Jiangella rhizosphaerae]RIQ35912.1 DUF3500 domain-containing protein [Jiangella rhizosphaerae]
MTEPMTRAATAFLAALDPGRLAQAAAPFDAPDRRTFTYLPRPRPGIALGELSGQQRSLALELLATGLSATGLADARAIMDLETVLGAVERAAGVPTWERRQPGLYWFRVYGTPGSATWGWRLGGHHLAVTVTVVDGRVTATPQFFGANPATVPGGFPGAGRRTLAAEQDLGRALVTSLPPAEKAAAITSPEAPRDILTRDDPVADAGRIAPGLAYGDMPPDARELLERLVRHYLGRVTTAAAAPAWAEIAAAGLEHVTFRWAGSVEPGHGHYYAVLGPTFLLEYDNTQHDANHVHSVWRDLRHDWGDDLLAAHHAAQHS